jgi:hypothetical protein
VFAYRDQSGPTIVAYRQTLLYPDRPAYDPMNDLHGARSEHRLRHHQRDGHREPQWSRPPTNAAPETSHISNTRSYTPSPTYPSRVRSVNAPCEGMTPARLVHTVRQPQRGSA